MLAFKKRVFDGNGFTDTGDFYVDLGSGPTYNGKVIAIISGSMISAAETSTLTMAQLPQTVLLGQNTSGALSDMIGHSLPIGWDFVLPNVQIVAPNRVVYGTLGIPPDILPNADVFPLSKHEAGIDSWLELALETARQ